MSGGLELPTLELRPEPWVKDAACRGRASDAGSYHDYWSNSNRTQRTQCATCPVAFECLEFSERIEAQGGIWGGFSSGERRQFLLRHGSVRTPRGRAAHREHIKNLRSR